MLVKPVAPLVLAELFVGQVGVTKVADDLATESKESLDVGKVTSLVGGFLLVRKQARPDDSMQLVGSAIGVLEIRKFLKGLKHIYIW